MKYSRNDGCAVWLSTANLPPDQLCDLMEEFDTAEDVYDLFRGEDSSFLAERINEAGMARLEKYGSPPEIHQLLAALDQQNIGVMTPQSEDYPDRLRSIQQPPQILFYLGDPTCLKKRCVSMVGSRHASVHGLEASETIARQLAESGVTIVSGLAMGVDAACHRGCLKGGQPTAAIVGCGLDIVYPIANSALRREILSGGGVIMSEYPPGVRPEPWHFPIRNRIIAGLSDVTVMMEAKIRSGSMTTVQHALDQGREVYAYPGIAGSAWAEGAHQLLREGATYFTFASDILEDMGWEKADDKEAESENVTAEKLSGPQTRILSALRREDLGFDQLMAETGMDAATLSAELTMLQIMDIIHSLPGKIYHAI